MAAQSFAPAIAPIVLLTRPAAQSARFADALRVKVPGVHVAISPLIAPTFRHPTLPQRPWQAIILSSETGAEAAGKMRAGLPDLAFCVGDRTAQAARDAGFSPLSAQGDAEALMALILSRRVTPLLHLRGQEARGDLAKRLSAHGIETDESVVYAQDPQPLTAEAATLLQGKAPILAPVFSPRTAEILVAECKRIHAKAPLTLIGMSPAVVGAVPPSFALTLIAAQPTAESMMEAVVAHLAARQGA